MQTKILAFSGSLRADSVNRKLTQWCTKELKSMQVEVTHIDLRDFPLEVYNPDAKDVDFPESASKLSKIMAEHHAWLISSPEYNYSITSCLKNVIDWVSRAPNNQPNLSVFTEKPVGILSASPSGFGGMRGLRHLRDILTSVGAIVAPAQASVSNAFSEFDDQGNLKNPVNLNAVKAVLNQLVKITEKMKS